jgi:hypothetical protein
VRDFSISSFFLVVASGGGEIGPWQTFRPLRSELAGVRGALEGSFDSHLGVILIIAEGF